MSMDIASAYCNNCKDTRKIERKGTNHLLHFLITIILGLFTMGIGAIFWICIWVLSSMQFGGWRCASCGSKDLDIFTNKYYYQILFILIVVFIIIIKIQ